MVYCIYLSFLNRRYKFKCASYEQLTVISNVQLDGEYSYMIIQLDDEYSYMYHTVEPNYS